MIYYSACDPVPLPTTGGKMAEKLTKEQIRWRAESDAQTLAEAETIASDKTRLGAAKKEATRMAQAAADRAQKFVKVATTKAPKNVKTAAKTAAKVKTSAKKAAKKAPRKR
jgi:hypothetical protein